MANATKPEIGIAHQALVTLTCVQPRTSFDASPPKRNIKPWGDFPLLVFASERTRKTLEIGSIADPRGEKDSMKMSCKIPSSFFTQSLLHLFVRLLTSFSAHLFTPPPPAFYCLPVPSISFLFRTVYPLPSEEPTPLIHPLPPPPHPKVPTPFLLWFPAFVSFSVPPLKSNLFSGLQRPFL